jgi:hypothetical protein
MGDEKKVMLFGKALPSDFSKASPRNEGTEFQRSDEDIKRKRPLEVETLQSLNKHRRMSNYTDDEVTTLQEKLAALENENALLKNELKQKESQNQELASQIESNRIRYEKMMEDLRIAKDKEIEKQKQIAATLFQPSVERLVSDKDGTEKTRIIARYATLLDEAKHQNINLTKELNYTKEQLCLKEDKLKELTSELNKAKARIQQLTSQNAKLNEQLSELRTVSILRENLEKTRQELISAQTKLKSFSTLSNRFDLLLKFTTKLLHYFGSINAKFSRITKKIAPSISPEIYTALFHQQSLFNVVMKFVTYQIRKVPQDVISPNIFEYQPISRLHAGPPHLEIQGGNITTDFLVHAMLAPYEVASLTFDSGNKVQVSFVQEGEIRRAEAFLKENYKSLTIKVLTTRLGQNSLSPSPPPDSEIDNTATTPLSDGGHPNTELKSPSSSPFVSATNSMTPTNYFYNNSNNNNNNNRDNNNNNNNNNNNSDVKNESFLMQSDVKSLLSSTTRNVSESSADASVSSSTTEPRNVLVVGAIDSLLTLSELWQHLSPFTTDIVGLYNDEHRASCAILFTASQPAERARKTLAALSERLPLFFETSKRNWDSYYKLKFVNLPLTSTSNGTIKSVIEQIAPVLSFERKKDDVLEVTFHSASDAASVYKALQGKLIDGITLQLFYLMSEAPPPCPE